MADLFARLQAALADRYTLERELGRGGMAVVYLARDLKHDRAVAIKVLNPEVPSTIRVERFLREIRVAARLQHPHILPLHESGEANGLLYYVMPYVAGETVRRRLERERQLPLEDALSITRDVAAALEYAHRQGVVHRDIKPENILLAEGQAVVADFGIARALAAATGDTLTETGLRIGTPAYMSPEQASGQTRLDGRSDIYSLGCVVYEMLAGEPPFTGPSAQALIAKRLSEPVPHLRTLREVPEAVEEAVTKALARAPDDRFGNAAEFAQAIAEQGGPRTLVVRMKKPHRARLVLLAGAVVLVFAILASLWETRLAARARIDPKRIMVAVPANRTGDPAMEPVGLTAADYITRGLFETGLVELVDVGSIYVQGRTGSGEPAEPRELARRNGAGIVVTGSYDQSGDSLIFQTAIMDVRSGRVLQALEPVRGPLDHRELALEALRERVMVGLAGLLDPRLREITTRTPHVANYAAYQAFVAGQSAFWSLTNFDEAMTDFRQASRLDPTFRSAALWVGVTAVNGTPWPRGCEIYDSVYRTLEPDRDRLAAMDRLMLDLVHTSCHGGDAEPMLRIFDQAGEAVKASSFFQINRTLLLLVARRPRAAATTLRRLDPERDLGWLPDSLKALYRTYLTFSYHELGDYRNELQVARDFAQRENGIFGIVVENRALAGLGKTSDVLAGLERVSVLPLDPLMGYALAPLTTSYPVPIPAGGAYYDAALELRAHGHPEAALRAAELAVSWYRRQPTADQQRFQYRYSLARALELLGQYNEAESLMQRVAATDPKNIDFRGELGILAAWRGDTAEAKRIDRWLARLSRPYLSGWHTYYRAEIAAVLGDRDGAVELLRNALSEGAEAPWDHLHSDPAFTTLHGYPPFDELLRPKG